MTYDLLFYSLPIIIYCIFQRKLESRRTTYAPYCLINRTGYDLHVWTEHSGDGLDTELKLLHAGEEIPWKFNDWRKIREVWFSAEIFFDFILKKQLYEHLLIITFLYEFRIHQRYQIS